MDPGEVQAARSRDAVRVLFILERAGKPVRAGAPPGCVKVLEAEKRLQALDFWVRNPDYLAHEYLDRYEEGGRSDGTLLAVAGEIMSGREPELRRLGMLRFMFGAFETVDTALAKLALHGLAVVRRKFSGNGAKVTRTDYLLTVAGQDAADQLATQEPLSWYSRRAALAACIAGDLNGDQLKRRQYGVEEYGGQRWGRIIPPIADKVRERLSELGGSA